MSQLVQGVGAIGERTDEQLGLGQECPCVFGHWVLIKQVIQQIELDHSIFLSTLTADCSVH